MNAVALMYHDVTPLGREDASGFPGGDAARYKLTPEQFRAHLLAIRGRVARAPVTAEALAADPAADPVSPWILTFDDGGASAEAIADALEPFGWRGHFFVTTGYIDRPGFLDVPQLRRLRLRGHLIGSHSHTHPLRMARCTPARLREEWRRSIGVLADALGEGILTASVPGGHHSELVTRTAIDAGIRFLFTSQPTIRARQVGECRVVGRYAIQRTTGAATTAALAAGDPGPRLRRRVVWDAKQACKFLGGGFYLRARDRLLGRSPHVTWGDEMTLSASLTDAPGRHHHRA